MNEAELPEVFDNVRLRGRGNSLATAEGGKFTKVEDGRALCELPEGEKAGAVEFRHLKITATLSHRKPQALY